MPMPKPKSTSDLRVYGREPKSLDIKVVKLSSNPTIANSMAKLAEKAKQKAE